ncbi:N-acetylneuraminate synthase family protein [Gracilinema caldarium]|uniref:N-acetylneuraminate synthase family protein n=1 Tax=Gracilinema caldarium TaxID=215591 RepID=UPI0026EB5A51|nr:N-acetylneuraminate synthase family protein [Gracilinema caldarium]
MNDFAFLPLQPLIIAELGTGHGGDIGKAKELVQAALEAGADCIKFQLVYADEILHPNTGIVPLPGGNIRLYDRFKQLEVPLSFYEELKGYIEDKGKLFLCTPFGLRSARELASLNIGLMKIASPELNHIPLLETVASLKLPTILSSGVSLLADIELALSYFSEQVPICLLHCVTAYPAPEADYNVRLLENLRRIFGIPLGVSDHSMDPVLVPSLATLFGASVIEKHFCISRTDPGLDDPIALPPEDFARMVHSVREVQKRIHDRLIDWMGTPLINALQYQSIAMFLESPEYLEAQQDILREYKTAFGAERIDAILGDGIKRLAPSEKANYDRTNRSIHAVRTIPAGTVIGEADVAILRTEKVLRPGLHPRWLSHVIGRTARTDIPAGEGIRFDDL